MIYTVLILIMILIATVYAITYYKNYKYEALVKSIKKSEAFKVKVTSKIYQKQINEANTTINYYVSGDKENKTLIFVHPLSGDHTCFESQVDSFSNSYFLIMVDLIGHGGSISEKSRDRIDKSAEHLIKIIEAEGITKCHVVGVSLGALVVQDFANTYPDKVLSVTATAGSDISEEIEEGKFDQMKYTLIMFAKAIFSKKSYQRYLALKTVINPVDQARLYEITGRFPKGSLRIMGGVQKIINRNKKRKLQVPVLIMVGNQDLSFSKKSSQRFYQNYPNSKYYEIKNAGHTANMDNPEEFNRYLSDFLAKI